MPRGAQQQSAEVQLKVDVQDFRRLLGKSSEVPPRLRAAIRKRIREAADKAAEDARRTVRMDPETQSARPRHTGLRDGIANGIKVSVLTGGVRAGVSIRVTGTGVRPDQRSLVLAWESAKGFRHPVFGNTDVWVDQHGRPYFRKVIDKHAPEVTAAVEQAMRDAIAGMA